MHSWQSYTLKTIFRIKRALFDHPAELNIEKDRLELDGMAKYFKPLAPIDCSAVTAGGVPAEWVIPQGITTDRVILYIHGGSFNSGSIISHRPLAANLAIACNARALVIDYRLAPENPHPAALQDCLAVYQWLIANEYLPPRLAVMGDSAGGTLTLSLLILLRELGLPRPRLAACLCPATDMTMSGESWKTNVDKDIMLHPENIRKSAEIYLRGADPTSPLVSPLLADLHGLPPVLIQVGSEEVLLSDAIRFVEKAKQAGVNSKLEVWDGMQHVWQYTASFLPEARRAIHNIASFAEHAWAT